MSKEIDAENIICTQNIFVTLNGVSNRISLTMTEQNFTAICNEMKADRKLWDAFRKTILSFREIDRLNAADTTAATPLTTDEINKILDVLDRNINYGRALFSHLMEHAKHVDLETMKVIS